jgi:hypothetical protein
LDTVVDGTRHLRLAVRSRIGAELVQFIFPEGGGTRLTAINGRALPLEPRPTLVEHWGTPDPVILLDLEMAAGTQPELDVVEHLLRPQELVGPEPFQRTPELAPDIVWKSDRAMIRTPAAFLEVMPGPPPFSLASETDFMGPAESPTEAPTTVEAVPVVDSAAVPADTIPGAAPEPSPDTTASPDTAGTHRSGAHR